MIRIGHTAPRFRVPALVDGTLGYIDSRRFSNHWIVLCFVPRLGLIETSFLDRQANSCHFTGEHCSLFAVSSANDTLHQPWLSRIGKVKPVLLADPLGHLHRIYKVSTDPASRCRSFVIDPEGLLRFQIVHDLNGRGISVLSEILDATRRQPARAACERG
jgi:alkyl hydroperoxide reductase subunit AhpC